MVSVAWAGSSVGTSVRLKSGRSAVRPRPCPQAPQVTDLQERPRPGDRRGRFRSCGLSSGLSSLLLGRVHGGPRSIRGLSAAGSIEITGMPSNDSAMFAVGDANRRVTYDGTAQKRARFGVFLSVPDCRLAEMGWRPTRGKSAVPHAPSGSRTLAGGRMNNSHEQKSPVAAPGDVAGFARAVGDRVSELVEQALSGHPTPPESIQLDD
jgi:hypothetical protein